MTALALSASPLRLPELNWPRVSAYSGSLSLHLVLALALLIPPAAMELRRMSDVVPTHGFIYIEPEKVKPEPALPVPPQNVHRHERKTVVPTVTITAPINPVPAAPPAPVDSIAPPSASDRALAIGSVDGVGVESKPSAIGYGSRTQVQYPRESLLRREHGTVVLRVLVGADGIVQQIEVDRSSGSHALDNAARSAVSHWNFKPGMRGGIAYAAWALVPITFNLPQ
jgi:periplasmic protein TonB